MANVIKSIIKSGEYFDSITLMLVTKKIKETKGIIDIAIVMNTKENLKILRASGLYTKDFDKSVDNDLLISVKAESDQICSQAISKMEDSFLEIKKRKNQKNEQYFATLAKAQNAIKDANLALISVAGTYAATEAMKALDKNMNVMLFSDNVSIEEELNLKKHASSKKLLVMGPDCGTAIIGGVPLGFANRISSGNIGIVGASGTGTQEVSCLISNWGGGISHAIGTGGRDTGKDIGGITFLKALDLLIKDDATQVILLVSKPPSDQVLQKIGKLADKTDKKVVAVFLGAKEEMIKKYKMVYAKTLEEGARRAFEISCKKKIKTTYTGIQGLIDKKIKKLKPKQKYLRGLFSGGTFSLETQIILRDKKIPGIYANSPVKDISALENIHKSIKNTIIDMGADEFTQGRPHPMIDFTLRIDRLKKEIKDAEVACLYFDLVLGMGSNKDPLSEFIPAIKQIRNTLKKDKKEIIIIATVTGTKLDPQNKNDIIEALKNNEVIIAESNSQGAMLCSYVLKKINRT